jgi:hypothetical protein
LETLRSWTGYIIQLKRSLKPDEPTIDRKNMYYKSINIKNKIMLYMCVICARIFLDFLQAPYRHVNMNPKINWAVFFRFEIVGISILLLVALPIVKLFWNSLFHRYFGVKKILFEHAALIALGFIVACMFFA